MGEGKIKQQRDKNILLEDPKCYICGNDATTIDHQPPRSFFINRSSPQEFIFSCCSQCNEGSREADQIASVIFTLPTQEQFQHMDQATEQKFQKKLRSAVTNSKEPFLSDNRNYMGHGYFQRDSGLIAKANDGRSTEYRDLIHQLGYQEVSINKYGFQAIEEVVYKLTYAIFKYQKNKMLGNTIGPQFDGRVFYSLQYIDMSDEIFKIILKYFHRVADINHRQKSEQNFGFRYHYDDKEGALLFSAYFGGQFVLNVLAFNQKFNEQILSREDNPFDNGIAAQAGFKEIKKRPTL